MNSASKHAAVALLFALIAGCADKKAKTVPPPQAQAPAIPAGGKAGAMYPPPLTQTPTQTEPSQPPPPAVAQSEPPPTPPPPPPSTKKSTTHKSKPSAAKPTGTPTATTPAAPDSAAAPAQGQPAAAEPATSDVAAAGEPTASSPIGELTTGDTAGQAQKGKETNDLINNTENGLNAIKRPLSVQEQETANQIRTFLDKARKAYNNADLDGAFTLATKAKVLLDELNKT